MYFDKRMHSFVRNAIARGCTFELLDEVEVRKARNGDDFEDVCKLRYKAYRAKGFVEESRHGKCHDELDQSENVNIFGLYIGGEIVSTIRIHHLQSLNDPSPSRLVFPDIIEPKLAQGVTFIDSTRFTIDPEFDARGGALHFITVRLSVLACEYFDADYSLSLARPAHGGFYKRYFGFEEWGRERFFPGLKFPVNLFASDVNAVRQDVFHRLPFLNSLPKEREILFDDHCGRQCCYSAQTTARIATMRQMAKMGMMEEQLLSGWG